GVRHRANLHPLGVLRAEDRSLGGVDRTRGTVAADGQHANALLLANAVVERLEDFGIVDLAGPFRGLEEVGHVAEEELLVALLVAQKRNVDEVEVDGAERQALKGGSDVAELSGRKDLNVQLALGA